MRTSVVLLLSLSTAATFVNAKPKEEGEGGGGGALQALLERMQKTKHDNDHSKRGLKDAQVRPPPSDYSNGPDSFEQDLNNFTTSRSSRSSSSNKTRLPESVDSESSESATASSKFTKSTDRPSRHHKARPSPSSSETESYSSKSRLRSTDAPRRPLSVKREDLPTSALEKKLRVAESNNPFADEEFDSLTAAKPSTTAADKSSNKKGESSMRPFRVSVDHSAHLEIFFRTVQEKTFGKKEQHEDKKRWVWATQILQDDTPEASGVPPPGQNANLLNCENCFLFFRSNFLHRNVFADSSFVLSFSYSRQHSSSNSRSSLIPSCRSSCSRRRRIFFFDSCRRYYISSCSSTYHEPQETCCSSRQSPRSEGKEMDLGNFDHSGWRFKRSSSWRER